MWWRLTAPPPRTQAQALAALRSFLRWSRTMGASTLSADVVAEAPRTPRTDVRRPYTSLSERELTALLEAAENPRDRALLAVMLGAGLRVSEVVGRDVTDLLEGADGGAALYVRLGKGRKDRQGPVQLEVAGVIRRYLAVTGRRLGDAGPLFRAHDLAASNCPAVASPPALWAPWSCICRAWPHEPAAPHACCRRPGRQLT